MLTPLSSHETLQNFTQASIPSESSTVSELLLSAFAPMLHELLLRTEERGMAVGQITLQLRLENSPIREKSEQGHMPPAEREGDMDQMSPDRIALPAADGTPLLRLLHLELEAHPPEGGVVGAALRAVDRASTQVQPGSYAQRPHGQRRPCLGRMPSCRAMVRENRILLMHPDEPFGT